MILLDLKTKLPVHEGDVIVINREKGNHRVVFKF